MVYYKQGWIFDKCRSKNCTAARYLNDLDDEIVYIWITSLSDASYHCNVMSLPLTICHRIFCTIDYQNSVTIAKSKAVKTGIFVKIKI